MNNKKPLTQLLSRTELFVFVGMVIFAMTCRFLIETPNFKPIAAFALFAGFYFRKPLVGVVMMLSVLALTDLRIGFYELPMMVCVYSSIAVSVLLGLAIGKRMGRDKLGTSHWFAFLASSLVMSTVFFVLTNTAVWFSGWYPPTLAGLVECYVAALPFFRWTMLGDLFFTSMTVGSYAAAVYVVTRVGAKATTELTVSELTVSELAVSELAVSNS